MKEEIRHQTEEMKKKIRKIGPVRLILLLLLAAATICSYIFNDYIFAQDSIFNRGLTGNTVIDGLLGLVPNIIQAVRVVTIVLVVMSIVMGILNIMFAKGQRGITIVRLINNMLRAITAIVLVIAVLAIWGIDTTALITGAGVVTLIVGLGMQSLIADVVAGLFIVFENEFNVGDIITIGDFRGTVVSIGIRTTKLEALGNIKIINNSDIRGVLNQTVQPSTAKTLIDVEYGDSLEKIDGIIKSKLPEIAIEGILEGGICYDGVAALGASGVTLQFTAKCNEGDIFSVQREMNKRIKIMFDENGIGIPFPQLVVHTAPEVVPAPEKKKRSKTTIKNKGE